ncbi:MAG: acylneuraminate cytidylyltransferase family protein [Lachnospiraceae bacterium]|nr:acylneuraminate cytidylyltransferase family protein [Lachnospiraceae bacterium]
MNILAIIPARSGSKSVPNKNIRLINGKPMLAYSVEHALASRYINRVILDTDSLEYAEIGKKYGAEVPYLRPAEYATDTALDFDVFYHALTWLKENEGYEADIVVQLRPTYPKRNPADIDAMIEMLMEDRDADSVRSIAPAGEIPYKMWTVNGTLKKSKTIESLFIETSGKNDYKNVGLTESELKSRFGSEKITGNVGYISSVVSNMGECYNSPRQELPVAFYQNACIDVFRSSTILYKKSMTGDRILGYVMDENLDIDTEQEMVKAGLMMGGKRLVFDIDGVIAKLQPENNYALSEPDTEMIDSINKLYDAGNEIVLHTARGYVTGKDWQQVTMDQLAKWGLKYHELHFGKPNADYYIDDKSLPMEVIRNI